MDDIRAFEKRTGFFPGIDRLKKLRDASRPRAGAAPHVRRGSSRLAFRREREERNGVTSRFERGSQKVRKEGIRRLVGGQVGRHHEDVQAASFSAPSR
jgi:hypothetical protein